jgi:hypothetical protein
LQISFNGSRPIDTASSPAVRFIAFITYLGFSSSPCKK